MSDFTPTVPIALQIRKIIFEKFNDIDNKFTNDEIFEIIKSNGDMDPSWIIDDTESLFYRYLRFWSYKKYCSESYYCISKII